jgi:DNA-binding LacI/PurR family transcriptional regulator
MSIKIKDIANALDLSSATVSLVINNKPGVRNETREKIFNYINEHGYNMSAKKVSLVQNRNIRFIVYKKHGKVVSDTPFFSQLIEGIEAESRKSGYNLVVSYDNKSEDDMELLKYLTKNPPEGIIILATEMSRSDFSEFEKIPVPIVLLDNSFDGEKIDTVAINNELGAFEATAHLIEMGYNEIGYLHSSVNINNFTKRKNGFQKALDSKNIQLKENLIFSLDSTIEGAYMDMLQLLKSGVTLPGALFADNDIIAFGAIKAMKEFKIRIPEDISIIGFDDMPFCTLSEPTLSTIKVFKQRMGMIAVSRLIEKIEGDAPEFVKIEVGTELVIRDSILRKIM